MNVRIVAPATQYAQLGSRLIAFTDRPAVISNHDNHDPTIAARITTTNMLKCSACITLPLTR